MQRPISDHIRSNVWAIAACFIAAMGTAVVANASDSGPEASKSVADPAKQVRKLKQKLASVEQRLAALEGKAAPSDPATERCRRRRSDRHLPEPVGRSECGWLRRNYQ